jgi:hypothetical protein
VRPRARTEVERPARDRVFRFESLEAGESRRDRSALRADEVASLMVISPTTAKTHVSRAMTKLRACDRAQLVVFAYESGLVKPP